MEPTAEPEDFEEIIQAAEALLSKTGSSLQPEPSSQHTEAFLPGSESSPEPELASRDAEAPPSTAKTEPLIGTAADAQETVEQKLRDGYGDKVEVSISNTTLESDELDGRRLWVVKGDAEVRRRLFRKKKWHFTYVLDAADGKMRIVRSSRM